MEWTDSALTELDRIIRQIRASLNPEEVDVEEVAEDIQRRIEEELAAAGTTVITEAGVRRAAARIGVEELGDAPAADPMRVQMERSLNRPARIRSGLWTGWLWLTGILLPLAALGTELFTHVCLESGLPDPLPTPIHALLIATVPLFTLPALRMRRGRKSIPLRWLGLLGGIALTTAIYNAVLFATITPFAVMGLAAVIYFGVGLICLLPLSPLLSLSAVIPLQRQLRKAPDGSKRPLPWFRRGMWIGLAVLVIASLPMYLTRAGLSMAASDSPDTATHGIRLLRAVGDEALMNRACYHGANMPTDLFSWLITGGHRVSPDEARDIYYRVTGAAFHTKAAPTFGVRNRRNPGDEFDWDPETGGDVVAGRLKGLSLSDSRIDGKIDPDAATAYLEWTLVFRNEWDWEREARAQLALPPGAVVSRLTLWIDGEEREAAFGGRSQVKQAYKQVVRRRRDPVLVTTCGPDRVLMQCYPVPAGGEMKVRIGMTAPLTLLSETDRVLKAPCFLERNFRIPEGTRHAVWIGDALRGDLPDTELSDTLIHTHGTALKAAVQTDVGYIEQTIHEVPHNAQPVRRLNLVIDTSACMQGRMEAIAQALEKVPDDVELHVFAADDEPREIDPADLTKLQCAGGKENGDALRQALMSDGIFRVVWIHGPQTWSFDAAERLRQVMERERSAQILEYQIGHGPHRLIEKMDNLPGFISVPAFDSPEKDLARLFASLNGAPAWTAERQITEQIDPDLHRADDHLERLYALDCIQADLIDGDSDVSEALALALKHHLVTPVSGAVVLETQAQYNAADLKPVDSTDVPNVPEPGSLMLIIFAALLLLCSRRLLRHVRLALGR